MADMHPPNAELVGKVKAIYQYPVKSLAGRELEEADCIGTGIRADGCHDRQWVVVTAKDHVMQFGHIKHKLVTIKTHAESNNLVLSAKGLTDHRVPVELSYESKDLIPIKLLLGTINLIDCGDEVGAWLDKALGEPEGTLRLLYHPMTETHRSCRGVPEPWVKHCKPDEEVLLQHGMGYHMLSTASVDDLNRRLEDEYEDPPVMQTMQFRPNIEIEGPVPYAEDYWEEVYIGDKAKFHAIRHCDRCAFTTVDLETGKARIKGEPLKTLKKYRPLCAAYKIAKYNMPESSTLGLSLNLEREGPIKVGDPVYAVINDDLHAKLGGIVGISD